MSVNILVECPELIASVQVGVLNCLLPLEKEGLCKVKFIKTNDIKSKDIIWCDILITVRGCEYPTLKVIQVAKKLKRLIVYYLDDDLLNVPIGSSCPKIYFDQVIKKNMTTILSYTDFLWGVNPKIKEKYLKYCTDGRWITNKVPMNIFKKYEKCDKKEKIRILYAGSVGHQDMVQEILSPVVKELAIEYKDKVEFVFLGANSGIVNLDNVLNYPIIDEYSEYKRFVEEGNFSIGLAVVKTEEFYQCKYYNKFIEYSSIGCVGVYTNAKPYTYVVINGYNGFFCNNNFYEWKNAIKKLIDNRELRERCIKNAQRYLKEHHNYEIVTNELKKDFKEIIFYKAPTINRKIIMINPKYIYIYTRFKETLNEYGIFIGLLSIIFKSTKKLCYNYIESIKRRYNED